MIHVASASSDISKGLEQLEKAREKQRWSEWIKRERAITPKIEEAAESVENSWFDLSPSTQADYVELRRQLYAWMRVSIGELQKLDLGQRLLLTFTLLWFAMTKADLLVTLEARSRAQAHLLIAIDRALQAENYRRICASEALSSDDEALASIKRGEDDFKSGQTKRYTYQDFQRRFSTSA